MYGKDDAESIVCPASKEIGLGERLGGFDLAMIHIGYVQFLLAFRDVDGWLGRAREIQEG